MYMMGRFPGYALLLSCPSEIEATKQGYPTISGRLFIYGRFCNHFRKSRQGRTQKRKQSIQSRHATGMPHRCYRTIRHGVRGRKSKRQALSGHDGLLARIHGRHAIGNCGQSAGCRVPRMATLHRHPDIDTKMKSFYLLIEEEMNHSSN